MATLHKIKLLLLFLLLITSLKAEGIDISGSEKISLLEKSALCIVDADVTLQELQEQNLFQTHSEPYFLGGITTQAVWIRFTLKNSARKPVSRVLVLTSPFLEEIALYAKGSVNAPVSKGLSAMTGEDTTLFPFYRITVNAQSSQEYYVRVKNSYSPVGFALEVQDETAYKKHDRRRQAWYIVLVSIIFVLMMISVFMLRSDTRAYIFYTVYLIVFIAQQATYIGLTKLYIPSDFVLADAQAVIVKVSLIIITFSLFSMHFLSARGRVNDFYKISIAVSMTEAAVMYIFPSTYSLSLSVLTGATFITLNLAIGIYIWITQHSESARYFVIGYAVASACYMVIIVNVFGFSSLLSSYHEIVMVGTIIEAFIFLFAFGHYRRISKLEQSIARLKQEKKAVGENRDTATAETITIYRECHYRVDTKELMLKGEKKHLLPKQRVLFELLLHHRNRVVTYEEIGAAVWKGSGFSNKSISELVSTLRSTLENKKIIKNRSGMGYMMEIQ